MQYHGHAVNNIRGLIVNNLILGASALFLLSACGQESAPEAPAAEPVALSSGLDLGAMDTSVKPGDDFFRYVNGTWLDETDIPADKSNYGGAIILVDGAVADVRAIVEASANGDFAKGTDEQKVGDLYKSYLNMERRNALGVAPLMPELERIDAISSHAELAHYFGDAQVRGYATPMNLNQFADMKNPDYYGFYVFQGGLGLPDREFYFTADERTEEIRVAYVEHVEKMFGLAGLDNGAAAAATVMALETRIAEQHMLKEVARDWAANYNKVPVTDLGELMPNFDWTRFLSAAHLAELDGLIVIMSDYMRALDGIIQDTDLDTWKTYLKWGALNTAAARLNADLDKQDFEFYSKTLSGTPEQQELWRRAANTVSGTLGEVVGKVYVKKHFPPEAKERMEELVANLIFAYEKSIKELDWMGDETKAEALDKLSRFTPKIGYPDEWRDYSALDVEPDDLFGNLERATIAEHARQVERQGGPIDPNEWGMTPQTVNAYYSPTRNEIVFPAAILQPPFFNMEADEAVNYGAIGSVIGHEIGHGFDNRGSAFDGGGVLRNWWTDEDRAEFEKRTDKLVAQYDAFKPFDDLALNGTYTLGENIGDLGGISIGLLAYEMSLNGEEPPVIDGFTGVQRVFLGNAQGWRRKYREETLRTRTATDTHAPEEFRTNGPIRNVPEFYEAFDVQEGDALYLPPEERVKIW
jgi:putative endopeptidase